VQVNILFQDNELVMSPYQTAHWVVLTNAFIVGDGESVTCYSCGIVSTDWTSRCDVFIRHARSSPTCAHIISTRGQQFVDDVLAEFGSYRSRPAEDKITVSFILICNIV